MTAKVCHPSISCHILPYCPQVCLDSNAFHDGSELSHRQDCLIQPFVGHGINIINLPRDEFLIM